jgi:hypothetical protein
MSKRLAGIWGFVVFMALLGAFTLLSRLLVLAGSRAFHLFQVALLIGNVMARPSSERKGL